MLALLEIDQKIHEPTFFEWRSFRTEPADSLLFDEALVPPQGTPITLKFGEPQERLPGQIQTLFAGFATGSNQAINHPNLFMPTRPRSWRNITLESLVRDLCEQANLSEPTLGLEERTLPFFQGRANASQSFQALLKQLEQQGDLEAKDATFYVDPAGNFYIGRFRNWKREVEVIEEGVHVIAHQTTPLGLRVQVVPNPDYQHSQLVYWVRGGTKSFWRMEGVRLSFYAGRFEQELKLKPHENA